MSAVLHQFEQIEKLSIGACKCGRPYTLVNSMMNIRTKKWVRLFECRSCGSRTWDE